MRSGCHEFESCLGQLVFPAFVLFDIDRHIRVDLSDDEKCVRNMPCHILEEMYMYGSNKEH